MIKNKFYALAALLMLVGFFSFSQRDDLLDGLLKKLDAYTADYSSEKVHLQLDKPYYSIGDDIFFKAYVVNTTQNELSALSKVLYIDVTDDQDSLRTTMVMPLANGLCYGSLKLTDSLVDEGVYHIRAYTRWMLNFDHDFVFKKDITIGDANTPSAIVADTKFEDNEKQQANIKFTYLGDGGPVITAPVNYTIVNEKRTLGSGKVTTDEDGKVAILLPKSAANADHAYLRTSILKKDGQTIYKNIPIVFPARRIDLQFFPESGVLVNGIRSKVAFKATAANGLGAEVEGYLLDKNNARILDFKTEHAGMGIFALLPDLAEQYTAVITSPNVAVKNFKLPVVQADGFVLSMNHLNSDSLSVKISTTTQQVNNQSLTLMGLQNGKVKLISKINLNKPLVSSIIRKEKFTSGIVQFTLFSPEYKPLAERLVFVNNNTNSIQMSLGKTKAAYGKREKVDVELDAKAIDGSAVVGSFSVAVTNQSKVMSDEDDENTILSDFLLSSDLKGYIEQPNYYFNEATALKVKHLDYLMLTQGWRRFNWSDLSEDKLPKIKYQAQKGLELTGLIANLQKKPVPNGKVELFANTAEGLVATTALANSQGNFVVGDLAFTGNATFTAKGTNTLKNRNVNIYFDKPLQLETAVYARQKADFLKEGIFNYLKNTKTRFDALEKENLYSRGIVLKDVEIKATYLEKHSVKGSKKLGNAVPDIIIDKEKLKNYSNIVQAFYGLPGIEVLGNGVTDAIIALVGRSSITGGKTIMKVILDGSEISPDMLKDIPPASIEGIEILKHGNAAIYNSQGVIVLTSKSGSDVYYAKYALNSYALRGYHVSRDFYAPVYDKEDKENQMADLRSTIFWKPDLTTDDKGKASFSYYTADEPGKYKVVIEGLDINGRLARKVSYIEVK